MILLHFFPFLSAFYAFKITTDQSHFYAASTVYLTLFELGKSGNKWSSPLNQIAEKGLPRLPRFRTNSGLRGKYFNYQN
jgi:hypothetical protein